MPDMFSIPLLNDIFDTKHAKSLYDTKKSLVKPFIRSRSIKMLRRNINNESLNLHEIVLSHNFLERSSSMNLFFPLVSRSFTFFVCLIYVKITVIDLCL